MNGATLSRCSWLLRADDAAVLQSKAGPLALQYSSRRPSSAVVGVSRISYYVAMVLILPHAYPVNSSCPDDRVAFSVQYLVLLIVFYVQTILLYSTVEL